MSWIFFLTRRFQKAPKGKGLRLVFLLSIVGMTLGVAFLLLSQSVAGGLGDFFEKTVLDFNAHIIVRVAEEKPLETEAKNIEAKFGPEISGLTPFLYREGLMVFQGKVKGVSIKGISPEHFSKIYGLKINPFPHESSSLPELLSQRETAVLLLGSDLARELKIQKTEKIRVFLPRASLSKDQNISREFQDVQVVGTFSSGFYNFDSTFAFMNLEFLQKFYQKPGAASGFEIRLRDSSKVLSFAKQLQIFLGPDFEVVDWKTFNATLFEGLSYERRFFFIVFALVVFVAAFNVGGFVILMIFEKSRELSILLALGARHFHLKAMMTLLGLWLGILGSISGIFLGLAMIFNLSHLRGFDLDPEIYWVKEIPFQISWNLIASVLVASLLMVVLVVQWSLRRLAKIPLDL